MMKAIKYLLPIILFPIIALSLSAKNDLIISSLTKEMNKTMEELKTRDLPPYFILYEVIDEDKINLVSSFGVLKSESETRKRTLDIDLRVGDYDFDNTHIIRGQSFSFGSRRNSVQLPIEDDELALRKAIWTATDKAYKSAIERYEKVTTNKAVKVEEEDDSPDLSREPSQKYFSDKKGEKIDAEEWKSRIKRLSAKFSEHPWIYYGGVSVSSGIITKTIVNSEGAVLQFSEPSTKVFLSAQTKAEDGMSLPLYKSFFAFDPADLPSEKEMAEEVDALIAKLKALRDAPMMDTYTGPAILSGEASGVFFHEIFGHRAEGHRLKDPNNSQTFKNSIDKPVIADFLDVNFDPTIKNLGGKDLAGYYTYDDEGVKAEKVTAVDDGNFKEFLMSRSPIEGFPNSNGHGRKAAGYKAVSRQSNLIVEAARSVSKEELKQKLIEECKKQNKEYGLYFEVVQGGFTFTGRSIPNSFNVNPLVVYKIYVDGRPDEIVRGVDLIGTPLTTFSNIIEAANDIGIFNGTCGAESGGVPVSAVSPSLLVSRIEVQKKKKSQAKPPILPAPNAAKAQ
jgi:TldD protein